MCKFCAGPTYEKVVTESASRQHEQPNEQKICDRTIQRVFLAILVALAILGSAWAEDVQAQATDYTKISPAALVKNRPKGKLTNPYKDTDIDVVAQGEELYQRYSCGGCHGGGGGGGMGPPLTNDIWIYGGDDDTLFRLVVLGSVGLQKQGYSRKSGENVVGPMAPFDKLISSSDDIWRIIVFVRSKYQGDPAHKSARLPKRNS